MLRFEFNAKKFGLKLMGCSESESLETGKKWRDKRRKRSNQDRKGYILQGLGAGSGLDH